MWKFNGKISLLIFEKNTMLKLEIVEDWIYWKAKVFQILATMQIKII